MKIKNYEKLEQVSGKKFGHLEAEYIDGTLRLKLYFMDQSVLPLEVSVNSYVLTLGGPDGLTVMPRFDVSIT